MLKRKSTDGHYVMWKKTMSYQFSPLQPSFSNTPISYEKKRYGEDNLWNRWQREYLMALHERHNLTHKVRMFQSMIEDVIIVKMESKNRCTQPLVTVKQVYPRKDGVIRSATEDCSQCARSTYTASYTHLSCPMIELLIHLHVCLQRT